MLAFSLSEMRVVIQPNIMYTAKTGEKMVGGSIKRVPPRALLESVAKRPPKK